MSAASAARGHITVIGDLDAGDSSGEHGAGGQQRDEVQNVRKISHEKDFSNKGTAFQTGGSSASSRPAPLAGRC